MVGGVVQPGPEHRTSKVKMIPPRLGVLGLALVGLALSSCEESGGYYGAPSVSGGPSYGGGPYYGGPYYGGYPYHDSYYGGHPDYGGPYYRRDRHQSEDDYRRDDHAQHRGDNSAWRGGHGRPSTPPVVRVSPPAAPSAPAHRPGSNSPLRVIPPSTTGHRHPPSAPTGGPGPSSGPGVSVGPGPSEPPTGVSGGH